jgi:3-methyl-2-oxobutanoate hydroxymethyltransferase
MAHVGLMPQHVRKIGGYRYQGRDKDSAEEILETAKLLEKAGAFAMVIEAVPAKLATQITQEIFIPTIGIGASENCDGQILVIDDLLGLNQEFKPKFVKNYEDLSQKISAAVKDFAIDVRTKKFPAKENLLL